MFQNNLNPPKCNNELPWPFSFLKPLLDDFKFIYILKII